LFVAVGRIRWNDSGEGVPEMKTGEGTMMKRLSLWMMLVAAVWLVGCREPESQPKPQSQPQPKPKPQPKPQPKSQPQPKATSYTGKLRHVVLFKFKDDASAAQVKAIEEKICTMPPDIPEILALEWGKDVSVEKLADGFTHCFLVSFEDPDGLKVYLPHAAHKACVELLNPSMEKVLVIDYIAGDADPPTPPILTEGKLRHVVLFQFKEGTTAEQIKAIEDKFRSLPARIPEMKAFEWGTAVGDRGANAGFTHCFFVTFDNAAGRKVYLPHPAHKEFGKLVGPSMEKVLVIDYIAADAK